MILIKSKDLSLTDLQNHGVWTWSSDLYQNEDLLVAVPITPEGLADPETLLIYAINLEWLKWCLFPQTKRLIQPT